jgi:hypothetical protein
MFQSLLGFLIDCNEEPVEEVLDQISVSIPIGFSDRLQHLYELPQAIVNDVSIPIGFSDRLQQYQHIIMITVSSSFNPYWVF